MARLQRKKQTSAKKKTAPEAGAAKPAGSAAGDAAGVETVERPSAEKEKKEVRRRSAPAPVRRPAGERLPPGKVRQWIDRGVQFLREVKVELKKVTWPSRKQTVGSTVVVIVLVLVISLFLGVVDVGLSSLIRVVLQQG
ncbi:MAG TPA: preprotein translocase subunit SecE [Desulfobacteraceae bacterium]|nr:preprotein translocase subunit SecE [Deltaproteobacteria bacterium]HDI60527.1 preprotein translocase subunit SecE [Desulfobacteraceae bacterium]